MEVCQPVVVLDCTSIQLAGQISIYMLLHRGMVSSILIGVGSKGLGAICLHLPNSLYTHRYRMAVVLLAEPWRS